MEKTSRGLVALATVAALASGCAGSRTETKTLPICGRGNVSVSNIEVLAQADEGKLIRADGKFYVGDNQDSTDCFIDYQREKGVTGVEYSKRDGKTVLTVYRSNGDVSRNIWENGNYLEEYLLGFDKKRLKENGGDI